MVKRLGPKKLMELDNELWKELGVKSGGELRQNPTQYKEYKNKLKEAIKGSSKLSQKTYNELEDNNFHTMNGTLCTLGKYPKSVCKDTVKSFKETLK